MRIELRQPVLPDDHADRIAELDQKTYERGISLDGETLLVLGRKEFAELLEADRTCRGEQRVFGSGTDLSSFADVFCAFARAGCLLNSVVPLRNVNDQALGLKN